MKAWLIPISLAVLGGTARADQCAWIDTSVAHKAKAVLASSPKYLEFCEPCGDKAPGIPQLAKTVTIDAADGDYKEMSINGTSVDLAYVFVKTDDTHYQNLAALAGCPATGVSPSLAIAAETTNGVLITADESWPLPTTMQTAIAEPPPPPAPPAPAPAPAPQIYVYNTTTHDIAWIAVVLAAAGGFVAGSAATLALVALRRRRDMRPRAVDIDPRS